jgi:hypothetical protein
MRGNGTRHPAPDPAAQHVGGTTIQPRSSWMKIVGVIVGEVVETRVSHCAVIPRSPDKKPTLSLQLMQCMGQAIMGLAASDPHLVKLLAELANFVRESRVHPLGFNRGG